MSEYRRRSGGNRRGRYRRNSNESRNSHSQNKGILGTVKRWFSDLFKTKSKPTKSHSTSASKSGSGATLKHDFPPTEVTSARLYVGNLSYDTVESDLFDLFSKEGVVRNVEMIMDKRNNRCKGFGFVEMDSLEVAKAASDKLNRTEFMGRQILVMGAKNERRDKETPAPSVV